MNVSPPLPPLPLPPPSGRTRLTLSPPNQIVEWAFGKRLTPQEKLRKHQRALEKTMRELDREKAKLENQQSKLQRDIKASAQKGQMNAAKVQAKDLARTRKYIDRFNQTSVQLKAISLRIQVRCVTLLLPFYFGCRRVWE